MCSKWGMDDLKCMSKTWSECQKQIESVGGIKVLLLTQQFFHYRYYLIHIQLKLSVSASRVGSKMNVHFLLWKFKINFHFWYMVHCYRKQCIVCYLSSCFSCICFGSMYHTENLYSLSQLTIVGMIFCCKLLPSVHIYVVAVHAIFTQYKIV